MMHYYDYPMNGEYGAMGVLFWIFWLVIMFDLVLVGIWLWQRIVKKP